MDDKPFTFCWACHKQYNPTQQRPECPHDTFETPTPIRQEKIRVVTKSGWWFDMERPADFNMFVFAVNIRSTGFLLNERIYQPASEISSIFTYFTDEAPPEAKGGVVIPFPGAPK